MDTKTQDTTAAVIAKAWESKSFKYELLSDPEKAIFECTGQKVKLPEGKKLVVVDQSNDNYIYLNIPPKPNLDDMELSSEELELIAGGGWRDWARKAVTWAQNTYNTVNYYF